jgi:hypothetical protein
MQTSFPRITSNAISSPSNSLASGDKLGSLAVYYAGAGAKRLLPSISQSKQIKLLFQSREPGRLLVISIALLSLQTAPSVLFAN